MISFRKVMRTSKRYGVVASACMLCCLLLFVFTKRFAVVENDITVTSERYIVRSNSKQYEQNRDKPIIFIGGMPRSGTTLLRVMLDAHPDIRCGQETRVVPKILNLRRQWVETSKEAMRLQEAGILGEVLDNAVAAFILQIIGHNAEAPYLCNKDPYTLLAATALNSMFPKAKFILLIRDGRAVVHSIISRKILIAGLDLNDYRQCLTKWNSTVSTMYSQCTTLGQAICMPIHYEQLVLHPKYWMEEILEFLKLPWNESVLHHDQLVDAPGGINISKLERSSDQVIKPINTEALSQWVGQIPKDVVEDMPNIAPMLATLGYDPTANPPDYGKPDDFVLQNNNYIKENEKWYAARAEEFEKRRKSLDKYPGKNKNLHAKKLKTRHTKIIKLPKSLK